MKFVEEYRDGPAARRLAASLGRLVKRPWTIMEICGGQTHAIVRYGIDQLLPPGLTLVHGPGCPVCVTPIEVIDQALALASRPDITFCSFGDMLRVPGSGRDLFAVRAAGGDVRIVYSPLDAVKIAQRFPNREVVFFAVGFETTAPAHALAVQQARRAGLRNFSLLVSLVLVPPAIEALISSPQCRVQGFLAAGHVCTVMGFEEYEPLASKYRVPIVVTGFEPLDILQGLHLCATQLEQGRAVVENQYARSVQRAGNAAARQLLADVFTVTDRAWRGLGTIPRSGLQLAPAWSEFDAAQRFSIAVPPAGDPAECWSGLVLQGLRKPHECPAFGTRCTPEHPLGATMVSGEGACAAYYRYRPLAPTSASPA